MILFLPTSWSIPKQSSLLLLTGLSSLGLNRPLEAIANPQPSQAVVTASLTSIASGMKQTSTSGVEQIYRSQGTLASGDEVMGDGSFYDEHRFQGRAGQRVQISLESSAFDPYLLLYGPNGEVLGENDDINPSNFNSQLVLILPTDGVYRVHANSYSAGEEGAYTLTVNEDTRPGDLQATLRWNTTDDLDLIVRDPAGEIISFETTQAESGGRLSSDVNALCENVTRTPTESIFWPQAGAPPGEYTVFVTLYSRCTNTSEPIPFTLILDVQGTTQTYEGTVDENNDLIPYGAEIY